MQTTIKQDLEKIQSLPSTFRLEQSAGINRIVFLRLLPLTNEKSRDLRAIESEVLIRSIEGFDATDCVDFGDGELQYISNAVSIEYLGLDGTKITDSSLQSMQSHWPNLKFLDVENCNVSQDGILSVLKFRKLVFVEIPEELNSISFLARVREISPNLIVMCGGKDVMEQPESAFDAIPWAKWN